MIVKKLQIGVLAMVALLALPGCELLLGLLGGASVTNSERIQQFEDALNTQSRSGMQAHLHPDMLNYAQLADADVWDSGPLSYTNQPFAISVTEESVAAGVTRMSGTLTHAFAADLELIIDLEDKSDGDAAILKLQLPSVSYTLEQLH